LATSIVATVNFLALAVFMRRAISRINGRDITDALLRILAASALMSAAGFTSYYLLSTLALEKTFLVRLIEALVPIAACGIVFLAAAKLFRIGELESVVNALRRKLNR
jgi:putative peptidoglycan lipid II flippase